MRYRRRAPRRRRDAAEAGANPNLKAKVTAITDRRHGDYSTGGHR
jgi:hypothetical protein